MIEHGAKQNGGKQDDGLDIIWRARLFSGRGW